MLEHLIHVKTWFPKYEVDLAEQTHYTIFNQKGSHTTSCVPQGKQEKVVEAATTAEQEQAKLSEQIRDVRKLINNKDSIEISSATMKMTGEQRLEKIEATHQNILQMLDDLKRRVEQLETNKQTIRGKPVEPKPAAADNDDIDLFGSDDEEESEERKKRLEEYTTKKSNKVQIIAKSEIVLDVKPWDDETDIAAMEKSVRSIEADGLVWGQAKHVPVAFGVKKLQIGCIVEDDKIGTDFLEEKICEFEEYVQSVDVFAFRKI